MGMTNEEIEKILARAEIVKLENVEVGKVYAIDFDGLTNVEDITYDVQACSGFSDFEDVRRNMQVGDHFIDMSEEVTIPFFYNCINEILFVQYMGNGIFRDIQSKANIAPVSILECELDLYGKIVDSMEFERLNGIVKQYQMFYDSDICIGVFSLDGDYADALKLIYYDTVLCNEELCAKREEIIRKINQYGMRTIENKLRHATNRELTLASVDNYIYDQTHQLCKIRQGK